jgi:hypothetical protein
MPSPQQITAATNIREVFAQKRFRYALLVAQCQAGKTGAFQELIRQMLLNGHVSHVYILCGSNETTLRDQAEDDTKTANPEAYASGAIKVIFRQKFETSAMDIQNALIVVDESHLDQGKDQQLDKFLGRHGLSMSGDPRPLNENDTYLVSVDATPYSEISELTYKGSFEKHVEQLEAGPDYFGLSDYFYGSMIRPTYTITEKPADFNAMIASGGKKYGLMRLASSKHAIKQEQAAVALYQLAGGKVHYYTSDKTTIAITNAEKVNEKLSHCLEDAPTVPTLVIIRGRLRAGKVVPKKHIAFAWEGAAQSKTDSLVQGLPGRMCGYKNAFGATKPIIFVPESSLKTHKGKVVKASEMERAIAGHPLLLPLMGTNLKKGHVANKAANGKTQCPPLRLEWPSAASDEWTPPEDGTVAGEDCRALLLKNAALITSGPFSDGQKEEILSFIGTAPAYTRTLQKGASDSFKHYFSNVIEAHGSRTACPEHVANSPQMTFFITRDAIVPNSNKRHLYVIFYTDANNGAAPSLMAVDIKSRIPKTNGKTHFSIHAQFVESVVGIMPVGIKDSDIKTPALLASVLRKCLTVYKTSGLEVGRSIQSDSDRFLLSKATFNYTSDKENDVQRICVDLEREFSVKVNVTYKRILGKDTCFVVKKIEW